MRGNPFFAHPTSIVEPGSTVGSGTRIWAFAHVQANAIVGRDCNIGDYVFIESGARLGNMVTVKNGVQIWDGVVAEDGVFFGPNCVLTNDRKPRAFLRRPREEWFEPTVIREGCTIGAGAIILCGVALGRFCFVAAGSLVTRDVPDFALVQGHPARAVGWVSRAGERLEFTADNLHVPCPRTGVAYRLEGDQVVELGRPSEPREGP